MNDRLLLLRGTMPGIGMAVAEACSHRERLRRICSILSEIPGYDWVGFYTVDRPGGNRLVLGPFSGAPTEHVSIEFGRGICGRAAETMQTIMVGDVGAESNYLSCSPDVRSEIVVPVFFGCEFVGELDIDSHRPDGFSPDDRRFLEWVAEIAAPSVAGLVRGDDGG